MKAKEQETWWENLPYMPRQQPDTLFEWAKKKKEKAHLAKSSLYVYKSYKQKGI